MLIPHVKPGHFKDYFPHYYLCQIDAVDWFCVETRRGPKPGCHEAEAFTTLEAKAEALTLVNLEAEAEALVTKPKPGNLYSTNVSWIQIRIQHLKSESSWILIRVPTLLQSRSFGKPWSRSLWKSQSRSQALKNLGSRSRSLDPKIAGFVKPKPASAHVWKVLKSIFLYS